MAAKPETRLTQRVHKYIVDLFYEKTNNPYNSGTPDVYYEGSGPTAMAWIEYKYVTVKPRYYTWEEALNLCTTLQRNWLERARRSGKKVGIIVGFSDATSVFIRPNMAPVLGKATLMAEKITDYVLD